MFWDSSAEIQFNLSAAMRDDLSVDTEHSATTTCKHGNKIKEMVWH
jgi:hypothetical protein